MTNNKDIVLNKNTELILNNIKNIKDGDTIEGPVLAITKNAVYVDLGNNGTGRIYGIEYIHAKDLIKRINIGDLISAKVLMALDKDGYIDLSLQEARFALIWTEAEQALKEKRNMSLVVKDANKGGLILE